MAIGEGPNDVREPGLGVPPLRHTAIFRREAEVKTARHRASRTIFFLLIAGLLMVSITVVPLVDGWQSSTWQSAGATIDGALGPGGGLSTEIKRKGSSSRDAIARVVIDRGQTRLVVERVSGASEVLRLSPSIRGAQGRTLPRVINRHGIAFVGPYPEIELGSIGISRTLGARDLGSPGLAMALDRATLAWLSDELELGVPIIFR